MNWPHNQRQKRRPWLDMEVTNDLVEWDQQEDFEILRQFLNTRTGKRVIPKMLESMPALLAKGDVSEIFIRSGEVRGWQAAVSCLLGLATVVPESDIKDLAVTEYAAPEDDSKWNDGQRLSSSPKP